MCMCKDMAWITDLLVTDSNSTVLHFDSLRPKKKQQQKNCLFQVSSKI